MEDLFHVDVSQIVPSDVQADANAIDEKAIMATLDSNGVTVNDDERTLLAQMFRHAGKTTSQLRQDIYITESLQDFVLDWVRAFAALSARDYVDDDYTQPRKLH
jgi:hypothetical protein